MFTLWRSTRTCTYSATCIRVPFKLNRARSSFLTRSTCVRNEKGEHHLSVFSLLTRNLCWSFTDPNTTAPSRRFFSHCLHATRVGHLLTPTTASSRRFFLTPYTQPMLIIYWPPTLQLQTASLLALGTTSSPLSCSSAAPTPPRSAPPHSALSTPPPPSRSSRQQHSLLISTNAVTR